MNYFKQVLLPDVFVALLCSNILDKFVVCLGEKRAVLVNDECGSW